MTLRFEKFSNSKSNETNMFFSQLFSIVYVLQYVDENLGVMSVGFLLDSPKSAVIWRGPRKNGTCSFSPMHNFHVCTTGIGILLSYLPFLCV